MAMPKEQGYLNKEKYWPVIQEVKNSMWGILPSAREVVKPEAYASQVLGSIILDR